MASTSPGPPKSAYYIALDGLRAAAVIMVFFQHYGAGHAFIFGWGWTGVDIFFVLSGFLITGILYDSQAKMHRYRDFYIRRTLRILPLYYFVWLSVLLIQSLAHWQWNSAGSCRCSLRHALSRLHLGARALSGRVGSNWVGVCGFTLIDIFAAAIVLECIHPGSPLGTLLSWKPLRALGIVSYGFYVYHDLLHDFYSDWAHRLSTQYAYALTLLIAFVATSLVAALSYQLLEKPMLRLKDHFAGQVHTAPEIWATVA